VQQNDTNITTGRGQNQNIISCSITVSYSMYVVKLCGGMYCILPMCVCIGGAVGGGLSEVRVHSPDGMRKETLFESVLAA